MTGSADGQTWISKWGPVLGLALVGGLAFLEFNGRLAISNERQANQILALTDRVARAEEQLRANVEVVSTLRFQETRISTGERRDEAFAAALTAFQTQVTAGLSNLSIEVAGLKAAFVQNRAASAADQ